MGVLISKCINSSIILEDMFNNIDSDLIIVNNYYFWLILFCVSAIAFSFTDSIN